MCSNDIEQGQNIREETGIKSWVISDNVVPRLTKLFRPESILLNENFVKRISISHRK